MRVIFISCAIVVALFATGTESPANPLKRYQAAKQLTLDLNEATVPQLLTALSTQMTAPAVLDGHLPEARRVTIHFSGEAKDLLPSLGRMLDVDVRTGAHGAVYLVPKFDREPGEPQAEPIQINALSSRILRVLPNVTSSPNNDGWATEVKRLGAMLQEGQFAALRSGRKIAWNELSPAQKNQVAACIDARLYSIPRYVWTTAQLVTREPDKTILKLEPNTRQLLIEAPGRAGTDAVRMGIQLPRR